MFGIMRQIFPLCLVVSYELNPLFAKLDPEIVDVDVHSPPLLSSLSFLTQPRNVGFQLEVLCSSGHRAPNCSTRVRLFAQNWAPWRAPGSTRVGTVAGIEVEEADD